MTTQSDSMMIDIELRDCTCILHCEGRFVAGPQMEYMQTRMNDIKRLACTKLLVDFQNVPAIGSMGVAFLVGIYTSVTRKPGGRFVLAGANRVVQHVLDLTRLSTLIQQAPDLRSALAIVDVETPAGSEVEI